jgi:NADP-dependent 3-hydroxy acid dehydrogenase YdfG
MMSRKEDARSRQHPKTHPSPQQFPSRAATCERIARATVYALAQPPHVSLNELLIRPSGQEN